jgi:hypothetical protein
LRQGGFETRPYMNSDHRVAALHMSKLAYDGGQQSLEVSVAIGVLRRL